MQVIILGDLFTFPLYSAPASTNRVLAYAQGFINNGVNCYILTFSNVYFKPIGRFEKIPYFIALNQPIRNSSFINRNFNKQTKYCNTFRFFQRINRRKEKVTLIIYSRNPLLIFFAGLLGFLFSINLIYEVNEIPTKNISNGFGKWLFNNILLRFFDGFICISSYLEEYCMKYKKESAKIIRIPILTLHHNNLIINKIPIVKLKYIFYSGTLSFERDGIDILLKAFSIVNKIIPELHLILGGRWIDEITERKAKQMIIEFGISSNVIFTGIQAVSDYYNLVQNACICCIPRKITEETNAAFPTKLVDYLQYSRPVIITSVGDIPNYFTDDLNIFFIGPNDVEALVSKISYLLSNYEMAIKVAENGQRIAQISFSNVENVKLISNFLRAL